LTVTEVIQENRKLKFYAIYEFLKDVFLVSTHINLKELIEISNSIFTNKKFKYEDLQILINKNP